MAEADKILEAEKNIIGIVTELENLKQAADLLSTAQQQVDQIIVVSQQVISKSGVFAARCDEIIQELATADIKRRLEGLETAQGLLTGDIVELQETINALNSGIVHRLDQLGIQLSDNAAETKASIATLRDATSRNLSDLRSKTEEVGDMLAQFRNSATEQYQRQTLILITAATFSLISILVTWFTR